MTVARFSSRRCQSRDASNKATIKLRYATENAHRGQNHDAEESGTRLLAPERAYLHQVSFQIAVCLLICLRSQLILKRLDHRGGKQN